MVFTQPFDLYYFLVTTLSGSLVIFTSLALVFVAAMSAYFRMPNEITMISFALFIVLLAGYFGGIFVLIITLLGLLVGYIASKIGK